MQSRRPAALPPLGEAEIARTQELLDALPAPLEPLDVAMLDGYLCGVLLQPQPVAEALWLPHALDARDDDGAPRAVPPEFDSAPLVQLVRRRHADLDRAIASRDWFDPWLFELDAAPGTPHAADAVYPWVAGFALAMTLFPQLISAGDAALLEPLALVYRHLDADDLEDADELLAEIETLEPPADLAEAVEGLVRATLLLADVSRPRKPPPPRRTGARGRAPKRRSPVST